MSKNHWLIFDTSTIACSVAVESGGKIYSKDEIIPREHHARLLPMIQETMELAGVSAKTLSGIAIGRGPGSFVGIRLAAAVAQGLAFGWQKPVVTFSSLLLWVLSVGQRLPACPRVLLAVDAKMQGVYLLGVEFIGDTWQVVLPEQASSVENAPKVIRDFLGSKAQDWMGFGDAFSVYATLRGLLPIHESAIGYYPEAKWAMPLVAEAVKAKKLLPPEEALPVYLRENQLWRKQPMPPADS